MHLVMGLRVARRTDEPKQGETNLREQHDEEQNLD